MGIQAWSILLGVAVMTLIVWDGRRRKAMQRSTAEADTPQRTHVLAEPITLPVLVKASASAEEGAEENAGHSNQLAFSGTRIGLATHVSGRLTADEPVHIKGRVIGAVIAANHSVSVSATGHVERYIEGSFVDIDGCVIGSLKANAKTTLLPEANVRGSIDTPRLVCMAGARLHVDVNHPPAPLKVAIVS